MRLRILSDLHLDQNPRWTFRSHGEDAVLCAGDIGSVCMRDAVEDLIASCATPFYYTPGNHDAYDGEVWEVLEFYRKLERRHAHFHCLVNETAELGPFLLAGTPLWTNFALDGQDMARVAMLVAERHIKDFNFFTHVRARHGEGGWRRPLRRLRPGHLVAWHRQARLFLRQTLALGRPTIVLTHWVPSGDLISPRFFGNPTNPYYASNCEDLMGGNLLLWVHGHTHTFDDRVIKGTRLLRNPLGSRQESTGWVEGLVVEV